MLYYVSGHIRWCLTEDGLVILNLRTEKYLGLDAQQLASLDQLVPTWSHLPVPNGHCAGKESGATLVAELENAGILTRTPPSRPRCVSR